MSDLDEKLLQNVLKQFTDHQGPKPPHINADDLRRVAQSLSPSGSSAIRSLGFLVLSQIVTSYRSGGMQGSSAKGKSNPENATNEIARVFMPIFEAGVGGTEEIEVLPALSLLSAFFQVDPSVGTNLFTREGVIDTLVDLPDIFPKSSTVLRAIIGVLSQASGHKACRALVAAHANPLLESQLRQAADPTLRASAAIALTKLSRGGLSTADDANDIPVSKDEQVDQVQRKRKEAIDLTTLMRGIILNDPGVDTETSSAVLDAVEGLAYLSIETTIKEILSQDTPFLSRLFSLVPKIRRRNNLIADSGADVTNARTSAALLYGIASIVTNIVSFKPKLSEEEAQIDRLRHMAKTGATKAGSRLEEVTDEDEDEAAETDDAVRQRCKRLLTAGVLPALSGIARSDSQATRHAVARAYLSLVEEKANRGVVMQSGGAKTLSGIIRASLSSITPPTPTTPSQSTVADPSRKTPLDVADLIAIQALTKLAITTPPQLLFGPSESAMHDFIRPFSLMLSHPESTLLQRFESMMALTNLSSLGPDMAARVAKADGLLNKVEVLLLDENVMVRRAATELLCNLIASDDVYERYTGDRGQPESSGTTTITPPPPSSKLAASRLHILLALSDVQDALTRRAASGALAMLTGSPAAVHALLTLDKGPAGVFSILVDLIDPNSSNRNTEEETEGKGDAPGPDIILELAHRGVALLWNVLNNSGPLEAQVIADARKESVGEALVSFIRPLMENEGPGGGKNGDIVMSAAQSLMWLSDRGVDVKM